MLRSASLVIMALAATSVAVECASAQNAKPAANATNREATTGSPLHVIDEAFVELRFVGRDALEGRAVNASAT